MNEYDKQARDYCKKYGIKIVANLIGTMKYFPDDTEKRDVYEVTIKRINKEPWTFKYGDSIQNTNFRIDRGKQIFMSYSERKNNRKKWRKPSEYDILTCLTKYEVGDFDDFISDFGYEFNTEKEYIRVKQIHQDVKDEYRNVMRVLGDTIDELQEIQ